MGGIVHHRHGRPRHITTAVAITGKSESESQDVAQAFRSTNSLLDSTANRVLHVHVPDSFLGADAVGRWGWVYELGVSAYPEWTRDGRHLCGYAASCHGVPYLTCTDVGFGSVVSIRHVHTQGGYLHSHPHAYPSGSQRQSHFSAVRAVLTSRRAANHPLPPPGQQQPVANHERLRH